MSVLFFFLGRKALDYALHEGHNEIKRIFEKAPTRASWDLQNDIGMLQICTVNQLLFTATLYRDSSMIFWFVISNFHDLVFYISMGPHAICGSRREVFEVLANFAKFSRTGMNIGLQ